MKSVISSIIIAANFATSALAAPSMPSRHQERASDVAVANVLAINHPISGTSSQTAVKIPFGKLTHFDDLEITGFELTGVTVNIPNLAAPAVSQVACQRYQDQYGVQPGSAVFKKGVNASVSTNSVDFGWVLCHVNEA